MDGRKAALGALGKGEGASDEEICAAFARLAVRHHPDREDATPEFVPKFREFCRAYSHLCECSGAEDDDIFFEAVQYCFDSSAPPVFGSEFYDCLESILARRQQAGKAGAIWRGRLMSLKANEEGLVEAAFEDCVDLIAVAIRDNDAETLFSLLTTDEAFRCDLGFKNSPLHFAARFGRVKPIAERLLKTNAAATCLTRKNALGLTPLGVAKRFSTPQCVDFFTAASRAWADAQAALAEKRKNQRKGPESVVQGDGTPPRKTSPPTPSARPASRRKEDGSEVPRSLSPTRAPSVGHPPPLPYITAPTVPAEPPAPFPPTPTISVQHTGTETVIRLSSPFLTNTGLLVNVAEGGVVVGSTNTSKEGDNSVSATIPLTDGASPEDIKALFKDHTLEVRFPSRLLPTAERVVAPVEEPDLAPSRCLEEELPRVIALGFSPEEAQDALQTNLSEKDAALFLETRRQYLEKGDDLVPIFAPDMTNEDRARLYEQAAVKLLTEVGQVPLTHVAQHLGKIPAELDQKPTEFFGERSALFVLRNAGTPQQVMISLRHGRSSTAVVPGLLRLKGSVCPYFSSGRCVKGDACQFVHEGTPVVPQPSRPNDRSRPPPKAEMRAPRRKNRRPNLPPRLQRLHAEERAKAAAGGYRVAPEYEEYIEDE